MRACGTIARRVLPPIVSTLRSSRGEGRSVHILGVLVPAIHACVSDENSTTRLHHTHTQGYLCSPTYPVSCHPLQQLLCTLCTCSFIRRERFECLQGNSRIFKDTIPRGQNRTVQNRRLYIDTLSPSSICWSPNRCPSNGKALQSVNLRLCNLPHSIKAIE